MQQAILSRALARQGYRVSMVCLDHGQPDGIEIDGVKVYRAFQPSAGIPKLRFFHPRITSVWRAMKRADSDIYYQRCSGFLTGIVAEFCRQHGKKSIYAAANCFDFKPHKQSSTYEKDFRLYRHNLKFARDRWLYEYGVQHVDKIVVQTPAQQQMCLDSFRRDSFLIPNIFFDQAEGNGNFSGHILWVGSIRQVKRPELFIELARALPDHQFVMVGGVFESDHDYYESVKQQASTVPNLAFKGFIPYSEVNKVFDGAALLVCTSEAEGFPNTFLQAWSRSIPVVSFFDTGYRPDGEPIEHLVDNADQAKQAVRALLSSEETWSSAGERAKLHFNRTHSLEAVLGNYGTLFELLYEKSSGATP